MKNGREQYKTAIEKELKLVRKQESALQRAAQKSGTSKWKEALSKKVPEKVYVNLQKAFSKAFFLIFEKGPRIIEKMYDQESIGQEYLIHEFAFQLKADRASLKKLRKTVKMENLKNMAVSGGEGIGLGLLGIGLPDIVIFTGLLLKGIYETALRYGFDYNSEKERYFILKLMEVSVKKDEDWEEGNREIEEFLSGGMEEKNWAEAGKEQISRTAEAFAMDMLFLKFIQGLAVVGIIGGAGNPVYYNKVMKYVELKYRKRYLIGIYG